MGYALEQLGSERCKEIAEGLFEVDRVYGSKLNCCCPVHQEKNPSAFYNFEEDVFACRASSCGFKGDLVSLWCELNGLDSSGDGFVAFKERFVGDTSASSSGRSSNTGQSRKPKKSKDQPKDLFIDESVLDSLPPLPPSRIQELQQQRGWSPEVIEILDLREFKSGSYKKIAIPIRDEQGRLVNIRLYQPGADRFKIISWYDQKCQKCGGSWKKVKKEKVCQECGGKPNDYGRTRLFPAPSQWKRGGQLWIVEGEPDLICALSHGLNAVTQTAGCETWRDEFSEHMKGLDVVIAYDADEAGFNGAQKAAESISQHAKLVRVIKWPEVMGNE